VPVILSLLTAVVAYPMAVFLEGSAPALPRNPTHQEMRPPEIFADFSRRKSEHHTSHLALRTVFDVHLTNAERLRR